MESLPQTGTAALLEILSPYLDDDLINQVLPRVAGRGRPRAFSSAQLFRVSLLCLLTPAHSFNLLLKLLAENRTWRKFAHLPNRHHLPDAKMLHQFRSRLPVRALRQINASLLTPLLESLDPMRRTVAVMDATDLPAPTAGGFKKRKAFQRWVQPSEHERRRQGKVASLSATKSTRCVFGTQSTAKAFC